VVVSVDAGLPALHAQEDVARHHAVEQLLQVGSQLGDLQRQENADFGGACRGLTLMEVDFCTPSIRKLLTQGVRWKIMMAAETAPRAANFGPLNVIGSLVVRI
jgi:hypothetical protein